MGGGWANPFRREEEREELEDETGREWESGAQEVSSAARRVRRVLLFPFDGTPLNSRQTQLKRRGGPLFGK